MRKSKDRRVYVRYKDHGYEGQEILFATTDRERAFTMTYEDKSAHYYHDGYNQQVRIFVDESLTEVYEWRGDVQGFQPHPLFC